MADCITIKKLEVFARHGAVPEENVLGQKFLITAKLYCDTRRAGQTDDLNVSIDYAEVSSLIKKLTEENTFRLIERLAEYLAENILLTFLAVRKVELEVEKPWAPVMLPLETVSVSISRSWHRAYLSLGSNLGDKKAHLDMALVQLKDDKETVVERTASYIETKPVGYVDQDDFLNTAVCISTLRTPEELLVLIRQIESEQNRVRTIHWGPRTIDVDILLYDDAVIGTADLTIPHIELENRMFVLEPMCEIAPYVRHPVNGLTMLQMKERLNAPAVTV